MPAAARSQVLAFAPYADTPRTDPDWTFQPVSGRRERLGAAVSERVTGSWWRRRCNEDGVWDDGYEREGQRRLRDDLGRFR